MNPCGAGKESLFCQAGGGGENDAGRGEAQSRDSSPRTKQSPLQSVMLIRIVAPHFVAGVVVGGPAAPIIRYMAAWTQPMIVAYCLRKGWAYQLIRS